MKFLFSYLKKYRVQCILAPLFKMLEAFFDLTVPMIVADIIDIGIAENNLPYVYMGFFKMLLMALLGLLCSFTAQYFAAKAAIGSSSDLRKSLFEHIQSLSFSQSDAIGKSTLITRLTTDVNQVQNGINMFLRLFLRSPFIVFGALTAAVLINRKIAFIFVGVILILFIIAFGIMFITKPIYQKMQKKVDDITVSARENLQGARVIRAFGKEEDEYRTFVEKNTSLYKEQIHAGKRSTVMNPLTYVTVNIGVILVLWYGADYVNTGVLLSGNIIAFINYMTQILVELVKLANLVMLLGKATVSMGRIGQILNTKPDMSYGTENSSVWNTPEIIRFDNVSLRYSETAEWVLKHLTFTINKGDTVGIIGGTGSGKSSLIQLISRFYEASNGQVYVYGKPIQYYNNEFLRRHIAVVMQKSQLLSGSIRDNLRLYNQNATDEEIDKALTLAQAKDFVDSLPEKLNYIIEQGGKNLSGGQRQRLCIARALVGKPDILILDDSSSALDYATDAALRKSLKSLTDTTKIIISQRTFSIMYADKILVLDDGALVGMGTHEKLLKTCDVYREIHESVSKKEDE